MHRKKTCELIQFGVCVNKGNVILITENWIFIIYKSQILILVKIGSNESTI